MTATARGEAISRRSAHFICLSRGYAAVPMDFSFSSLPSSWSELVACVSGRSDPSNFSVVVDYCVVLASRLSDGAGSAAQASAPLSSSIQKYIFFRPSSFNRANFYAIVLIDSS